MLTPIANNVIIQPVEIKQGTLILTNRKPTLFKVISIGDDVKNVKPGNIIYLEKHYGIEIDHEGEKFLVIDQASILVKVD